MISDCIFTGDVDDHHDDGNGFQQGKEIDVEDLSHNLKNNSYEDK